MGCMCRSAARLACTGAARRARHPAALPDPRPQRAHTRRAPTHCRGAQRSWRLRRQTHIQPRARPRPGPPSARLQRVTGAADAAQRAAGPACRLGQGRLALAAGRGAEGRSDGSASGRQWPDLLAQVVQQRQPSASADPIDADEQPEALRAHAARRALDPVHVRQACTAARAVARLGPCLLTKQMQTACCPPGKAPVCTRPSLCQGCSCVCLPRLHAPVQAGSPRHWALGFARRQRSIGGQAGKGQARVSPCLAKVCRPRPRCAGAAGAAARHSGPAQQPARCPKRCATVWRSAMVQSALRGPASTLPACWHTRPASTLPACWACHRARPSQGARVALAGRARPALVGCGSRAHLGGLLHQGLRLQGQRAGAAKDEGDGADGQRQDGCGRGDQHAAPQVQGALLAHERSHALEQRQAHHGRQAHVEGVRLWARTRTQSAQPDRRLVRLLPGQPGLGLQRRIMDAFL